MTIVETVAVYLVIPLVVVLVAYGLVFGRAGRSSPRYRPGRPFAFAPVWFLSARSGGSPAEPSSAPALPSRPALEPPAADPGGSTSLAVSAASQTGGARGTW